MAVLPGMRTILSRSEDTAYLLDISRMALRWGRTELLAWAVWVDVVAQVALVALVVAALGSASRPHRSLHSNRPSAQVSDSGLSLVDTRKMTCRLSSCSTHQ